jgi:hypothetical protein
LESQLPNSEEAIEVIEPWHEVSLDVLPGRTQMGQAAKLALKHGWVVRAARTVSETKAWYRKNGNIVPAKIEEHLWVGGARPNFDKPEKVFLINKMYIKKNMQTCTFFELKQFILEN